MPVPLHEFSELWRAVNHRVHDRFRHAFRETSFPFTGLILLHDTEREPGVTLSDLARRSGIVKSHVSRMIDLLVGEGYVERQADPSDQRLTRLYLTQCGADKLKEMDAKAEIVWSGVVERIPEADLADVIRGLHILLAALERSADDSDCDSQHN